MKTSLIILLYLTCFLTCIIICIQTIITEKHLWKKLYEWAKFLAFWLLITIGTLRLLNTSLKLIIQWTQSS